MRGAKKAGAAGDMPGGMSLAKRVRTLRAGFIAPCLPTKTTRYPLAANGCMRSSMMAFGLPAQLFTGSLWRAARLGHPKWGA